MYYIYRIIKYLSLFFLIIIIFLYSLLYHTDKISPYFLGDFIKYINSYSADFKNLNIKSIEGNFASSIKMKDVSFLMDEEHVEIKEYNLKPNLFSQIY